MKFLFNTSLFAADARGANSLFAGRGSNQVPEPGAAGGVPPDEQRTAAHPPHRQTRGDLSRGCPCQHCLMTKEQHANRRCKDDDNFSWTGTLIQDGGGAVSARVKLTKCQWYKDDDIVSLVRTHKNWGRKSRGTGHFCFRRKKIVRFCIIRLYIHIYIYKYLLDLSRQIWPNHIWMRKRRRRNSRAHFFMYVHFARLRPRVVFLKYVIIPKKVFLSSSPFLPGRRLDSAGVLRGQLKEIISLVAQYI